MHNAHAGAELELGIATDYIPQGIRTNINSPVLQAGLSVDHHYGIYAGAWATSYGIKRDIPYEADLYAGWYLPLGQYVAIDAGATHFSLHNDYLANNDYSEWFVSLIGWNALTLGYRQSDDFKGSNLTHKRIQLAYVFNLNDFSIELFSAHNRYDKASNEYNWGARSNIKDYWQFRVGVVRSYKAWDYRINLQATSLPSEFNSDFSLEASMSRYFELW